MDFDTNQWYQITRNKKEDQSFVGTILYAEDHTEGSTFFQITNLTIPEQLWQIYPFDSTHYVLRSKGSGPNSFLHSRYAGDLKRLPGNTFPDMKDASLQDDSMLWQISPWNDGTFYMTNKENGTDWHMQVMPDSQMAMSSNVTAPQPGQRFSFMEVKEIDDVNFSVMRLTGAMTSSTSSSSISTMTAVSASTTGIARADPTTTPQSTSSSAALPPSTPSSTLSTGAKAGIGVGIAGVAVIALLGLMFFFLRRRKARASVDLDAPPMYSSTNPVEKSVRIGSNGVIMEGYKEEPSKRPAELSAFVLPAEMSNEGRPVELPANVSRES